MKLTVEKLLSDRRETATFDGVVYLSWVGFSSVAVSFRSVWARDMAKAVLESDGVDCSANHPQDATLFIRSDRSGSLRVSVDDANAI